MTNLTRLHASPFAVGFAAALIAASLMLPGAAKAEETFHRSLTVSGEGKISAAPDTAHIGAGVVSEADTAKEALTANSEAMNNVFTALEEIGIERRDIQTSQFNVSPVYTQPERGTNEAPQIDGYRVTNSLSVRLRDMDKIGPVLDKLVSVGSNQINGVSFEVSNTSALLDKAREDAVKDALRKAKVYAASAGVVIGRILTINEGGSYVPQPKMMMRAMDMAESSTPIASGEMELTANVNLVIEIE
ncbi:SIMPL domain-containing protein [Tepidicaulis sp. LMO-SS28]|uniref:SIMPL domain-containing protein n=1 Tax=Tepidicaulis sp. LMO-SS28 TaxID=3447455 RepID=UPI003EE1264A